VIEILPSDKKLFNIVEKRRRLLENGKPKIICDSQGGVLVLEPEHSHALGYTMYVCKGFLSRVCKNITRDILINQYDILYETFYDGARDAGNDEFRRLRDKEEVIKYLSD
jgi:hypothetical protein